MVSRGARSEAGSFQYASGPSGAAVTYTLPMVTDDFPGSRVSCAPAPGSTFQLGSTTVTCTATDVVTEETSTAEFTITVADTTPPALAGVPANISGVEATSALTPLTYTPPTATDVVDGSVPVDCDHPSGSGFPVGTTTVSCSATDAHGNASTGSFVVTVRDTIAPPYVEDLSAPAGNRSIALTWTNPSSARAGNASDGVAILATPAVAMLYAPVDCAMVLGQSTFIIR